MQLVAPFVGKVAVKTRKRGYTPRSGATAPFAPGDRALSAPKIACGPRPVGARNRFASAKGNQVGEAQINADCGRPSTVNGISFNVNDVPLAKLAREDCRLRLAGKFAMPANLDAARNTNEADAFVVADPKTIAKAEIGGVEALRKAPRSASCLALF